MGYLRNIGSSIFQLLSISFVLAYLLGILNIHFSDKNEYCAMTYMFEYPQFVRVTVPENNVFPQYGLYAYSEGRFTERARKMWFDGVPVLFLPGNSGSYMQARSLASVALRKAITSGNEYHFDYFTVGYNEELSGLYGGVLNSQTQFAAACIARILSLYKSNKYTKSVPNQVILIGHSMGGLIAKRLLAYPSTVNSTSIAITLATPLDSPVVNFDTTINDYYTLMEFEWQVLKSNPELYKQKLLLSFGGGPRDILVPSGLTSSSDSFISGLTMALPGVWVSTHHVGIVWCKQLVMSINKYLFDIVDPATEQITDNRGLLESKARQYFQANRSMILDPKISRPNVMMVADAFWYEDNRRIYQVVRPEITKSTYLMIRLVNFPQNRFVAVETVNVDDKDWVFGCNAKFTYGTYRYCKQATSLAELSRWTGADVDFGKRKLATIHLHSIKEQYPDWSHVIVKVSPTRKPITLNVDINDHASRQLLVNLPKFGTTIVKQETEANSLYYELLLADFNSVHEAHLLYVTPSAGCKAAQYHVSAEVHVPWAKNHEYYHYFTHLKQSPMKLRLYKSNPNITHGLETTEYVKITLLLDPQCTFSISISSSWYHRLAQMARNYSPVLAPYVAAIVLLAVRSNILHLKKKGSCMTIHSALMSDEVKPYYALVSARLAFMVITSVPLLTYLLENESWNNAELFNFMRSLYVIPAYMTALGILHVAAAAVAIIMVFSSQLAHRLLFRMLWRGGANIAEKVASGLQKVPFLVSVATITGVPLSCGAASLVAGAAFYAFMLSKMYEEYLEDYVYKLMAKVASKMCRLFTSKKNRSDSETSLVPTETEEKSEIDDSKSIKDKSDLDDESKSIKDKPDLDDESKSIKNIDEGVKSSEKEKSSLVKVENKDSKALQKTDDSDIVKGEGVKTDDSGSKRSKRRRSSGDLDEDLNNLNFHMMLFFMWMCVTLLNVPALLTWARNFKYSMVLKPDTSYMCGLVMSACSACLWQMSGPRKRLRHYDAVASLLFVAAVCILTLGPFSLSVVNYSVTIMYAVITLQQMFDKEIEVVKETNTSSENSDISSEKKTESSTTSEKRSESHQSKQNAKEPNKSSDNDNKSQEAEQSSETKEDCVCSESRIYSAFRKLRDKFDFTED